jgi:predicted membrane protein
LPVTEIFLLNFFLLYVNQTAFSNKQTKKQKHLYSIYSFNGCKQYEGGQENAVVRENKEIGIKEWR